MFCCLQTPWSDPCDSYQQQTGEFPGNRRFVKTGGNALAAAPQQELQNTSSQQGGDIVRVTIPPGVSPGQAILVTAPDGSGRTVMVTVPQGLSEGSTFMAEFPPSNHVSSRPQSTACSSSAGPPLPAQVEVEPLDYSEITILPPPSAHTGIPAEPFAQAVSIGAGPNDTTISPTGGSLNRPSSAPSPVPCTFGQPMSRNAVAPITPFGSTLHQQQQASTITPIPPPSNQKLLLVRVPPGASAGTTIHVSIPDEPGRLVAATVPPNVSEFHVAYQPSNPTTSSSRRNNPVQQQQSYNGGRNHNNRDSGMGSMLLPALGGAALGMMGMSMYDHAHHNNTYDNGNDYGGGQDDFAGGGFDNFGDFGGDF